MKRMQLICFYLWSLLCAFFLSGLEGCSTLSDRDPAVTPSIWPVNLSSGYVSSDYGWRKHPVLGKRKFHEGVDLAVDEGVPVVATADGVVSFAGVEKGYGNIVRINHGGGLETAYAHDSKLLVREGEWVKKGQIIALAGKTGRVTGEHVHYEIRYKGKPMNPSRFLPRNPW